MAGEKKLKLKIGKMIDAPEWYDTPLDKLDFHWSREEELELERYCEKILKNAEEEEMTPKERFEATWQGKDKDRLHKEIKYNVPYAVRTLDSFADAIKPGDLYKWPKLHVKGHLATAARFKLDIINVYTIAYNENHFGADAKMIDYGTPMMLGDPPVKTIADIEDVEVPDPKKHGLYPGYLWAVKELMRIMKKYGVDKVMPIEVSFCGDPLGTVHLGMTGFTLGLLLPKKDPELFKLCLEKATEWTIKFGKAVKELNPDGMYLCSYMGAIPPQMRNINNEYILELTQGKVGPIISAGKGNKPYLWHTLGASGWMSWMRLYEKYNAIGPDSFGGWYVGPEMPYEEVFEYAREKDLYCGCAIDDHIMLDGDFDAIEAQLAPRLKIAKQYPKHICCLGVFDYWTPQPYVDRILEMANSLGKF
ncbi:uroporphyrinogen decarboxylase family protein [Chloroflexota bacterium]